MAAKTRNGSEFLRPYGVVYGTIYLTLDLVFSTFFLSLARYPEGGRAGRPYRPGTSKLTAAGGDGMVRMRRFWRAWFRFRGLPLAERVGLALWASRERKTGAIRRHG